MVNRLCRCTGFSYAKLAIPNRLHKYVLARYLVMEYMVDKGYSYTQAAEVFLMHRLTARRGVIELKQEREYIKGTLPWRRRAIEAFDRNVLEWEENKDMDDSYYFILDSHL
jgi:transposase